MYKYFKQNVGNYDGEAEFKTRSDLDKYVISLSLSYGGVSCRVYNLGDNFSHLDKNGESWEIYAIVVSPIMKNNNSHIIGYLGRRGCDGNKNVTQ